MSDQAIGVGSAFALDGSFAHFIIDRMPVALTVYDAEGNLLHSNPTARRILGLDAQEVASRSASDGRWQTIHEDGTPFHPHDYPINRTLRTGSPCHEVVMGILRPDDSWSWVLINSEPVFNGASKQPAGVVAIFADVTESMNLKRQLYEIQKLDAIGKLSAGVAHDFRNVLQAITTSCDLIGRFGMDERTGRHVDVIRKATARATDLTQQLLAIGQRRTVQPRPLDLREVLTSTMQFLRPVVGDRIHSQVVTAEGLWRIHADAGTIGQVVMNLVLNARDAMPDGGTLLIEARNFTADHSYAKKHLDFSAGDYVLLSVSDNGCGIPPDVKDKIFEPYFSTKDGGGHAGLGLAVVYGIVKQQRGTIWVYSEPGKGTSFKIFFPRYLGADEQPSEVPVEPVRSSAGETILLVDDDEIVRDVLANILELNGYSVIPCATPEEAVAASGQRRIDLLLTDVVMRHMSGPQLAGRMPDVKVVYMSGYTDDAVIQHSHLEKGAHFLEKPVTARDLLRTVRTVLDG